MDRDWWEADGLDGSMVDLASPLKVRVLVSASGGKYLLDGHLSGEVVLQCDRCLEHYGYVLDTGFHVALVARQSDNGRVEVELLDEDLAVEPVDGFVIDLGEFAWEQVLLALPMKSLCRHDCAGLCPACGYNLNRGPCQCTAKTGHPGFSKLKQLKIKGD
jgi:DUF177 domain-containing protein